MKTSSFRLILLLTLACIDTSVAWMRGCVSFNVVTVNLPHFALNGIVADIRFGAAAAVIRLALSCSRAAVPAATMVIIAASALSTVLQAEGACEQFAAARISPSEYGQK